jgi:glycosyltransferase involved in cell wall biosynthesis
VNELVSILIPCFNADRWVAQAIESALMQTWPEKEVIVVDDGSTDASLKVIQTFGDRIRWESGPNRGGNRARNRLLDLAHGEWLQYLDADDYLFPAKVARQVEFSRAHPACDVIYSPVLWVRRSETKVEQEVTPIPLPHDPWILLARWWLPQTGGSLWRKSAVVRAGKWRLDQPCCQEHELYLRLLMAGARFHYFDECHVAYRTWSEKDTVSTRDVNEVRRQRLKIEERIERFLRDRNQLTTPRLQAVNQARFEIARMMWTSDVTATSEVLRSIRRSQPGFVPSGKAASRLYRLVYRILGFSTAEKIAAAKRALN